MAQMTTTTNIVEREAKVPFDDLPRTFRDAIQITRRLRLRYLWIDALCILQDSPDDWEKESSKMVLIYSNSFLTIAADASKDSFGGCFNSTSETQDQDHNFGQMLEIQSNLADGQSSTLLFWLHSNRFYQNGPRLLCNSPLAARGWVFQEKMLSPRTIHFSSSQVLWVCRRMSIAEDLLGTTTNNASQMLFIPRNKLLVYWYHILIGGDYSLRKFTVPHDRLVAISGLARHFYVLYEKKCEYIAGLWVAESWSLQSAGSQWEFWWGLAWELKGKPTEQTAPRCPSWTWASHDVPVKWPDSIDGHIDENLELKHWKLTLNQRDADPFGHIDRAYLVIEGLASEAFIQVGEDASKLWTSENCLLTRPKLDRLWPVTPLTRILCLRLRKRDCWRSTFLLLQSAKDERIAEGQNNCSEKLNSYVRIGIAHIDESCISSNGLKWLETGEETYQAILR